MPYLLPGRTVCVVAAACAVAALSGAAINAGDDRQVAAPSTTASVGTPLPLTEDGYASTVARCGTSEDAHANAEARRWPARDVVSVAQRFRPSDPSLLARAVLLHLEVAHEDGGESARAQRAAAFTVATRLLQTPTTAVSTDLRRRGVMAAIAALQGAMDVTGVNELMSQALAAWPGDPELLLTRGTLQETLLALSPRGGSIRTPLRVAEVRTALESALADYTAALVGEPTLPEARLRRGRVLHRLGQLDEARAELQRVGRDGHDDTRLGYLAALFLGSVCEDTGQLAEAETAYQEAQSRYPHAQTPYLALASLKLRQGRTRAAQQIVTAMTLGPAQAAVDDPRWTYDQGQAWDLQRRLSALRESVSQ